MAFVLYQLLFMFIILPALIIAEGWARLTKILDKHDLWWDIPYMLLVVLCVLLALLLIMGYH